MHPKADTVIKANEIPSKICKKTKLDNSVDKNEFQKVLLIVYFTLDGLSNATTHNPLKNIYQLAKIG